MNQIIATAQQILDFKVGNISVGSVIQGLVLLIIFNRIISMIMGPIHRYSDCIRPGCCRHVRSGNFPVRTGSFVQRCQRISYFSYEAL